MRLSGLYLACAAAVVLAASSAWGFIDPDFTPVHLARQSERILVGTLLAAGTPEHWCFPTPDALKGPAGERVEFGIEGCPAEQKPTIRSALQAASSRPAVLFIGTYSAGRLGYLNVGGLWLSAREVRGKAWAVTGVNQKMSGTYAGGTDMLIRMTRYILADPEGAVPVNVGTAWSYQIGIAPSGRSVAGLAVVEPLPGKERYLFAASVEGDRIFLGVRNDEKFEDATERFDLASSSSCFAWVDLDRDGRMDLVCANGPRLLCFHLGKTGRLVAEPAGALDMVASCIGLAPAGAAGDGAVRIVASTPGRPVLLEWRDGWKAADLPGAVAGIAGEVVFPCISADLDNDGYPEVLQPRSGGALFWKGAADGFRPAVRTDMRVGKRATAPALGDFDADGFLDVFQSDRDANHLWVNDGHGRFRDVLESTGSLAYKGATGASDARAVDFNHDGRTDLLLAYTDADIVYHFNRGFRCLGEEGDLRLTGLVEQTDGAAPGVVACASMDFNGDGSEDMVAAFTDGSFSCFYNDLVDAPGIHVRLAPGVRGPVTVRAWQGEVVPVCTGAWPVGANASTFISLLKPGEVTLKWRLPGKPEQIRTLSVEGTPPNIAIE